MADTTSISRSRAPAQSIRRQRPTVYLVDDDRVMRHSLSWVLQDAGYDVVGCSTADEMLTSCDPARYGCQLIDLMLPDLGGLELREKLVAKNCRHPFFVVSAHGNISVAVEALKKGAIDFLEKPIDRRRLLKGVAKAMRRDERRRNVQRRIDSLTGREREVLALVASGRATKEISRLLGISARTVESHRSHITQKMQVGSVAELVYMLSKHEQHNT